MKGIADLPLHTGHAPPWLFKRMVKLARAITEAIILEYGHREFLARLANPYWFQSLSLALGFDWHSSGTTTVTMGALKESIGPELGIAIAGGKGKTSRKTPDEITRFGDDLGLSTRKINSLIKTSKLSAKVDNACLQDGYHLYHHTIIFSETGDWTVIQQGMKQDYARRYHWFNADDFLNDPQRVSGQRIENDVMNLATKESKEARDITLDIARENPNPQTTLTNWTDPKIPSKAIKLHMPKRINWTALREAYEIQPKNFEELLLIRGIGPSTLRALALISDVVFGKPPSYKDPIRYSFAVGGKDGVPFPVDKVAMDEATLTLKDAIERAKIGDKERMLALKRLEYRLGH